MSFLSDGIRKKLRSIRDIFRVRAALNQSVTLNPASLNDLFETLQKIEDEASNGILYIEHDVFYQALVSYLSTYTGFIKPELSEWMDKINEDKKSIEIDLITYLPNLEKVAEDYINKKFNGNWRV